MKTKHTKGQWEVTNEHDALYVYSSSGDYISTIVLSESIEEGEANAKLIAEAGTVASECGLTPRQLLEQRNELLKALELSARTIDTMMMTGGRPSSEILKKIKEAIKKATK